MQDVMIEGSCTVNTLPKVLIVDDNKLDRILYKEMLGEEHFSFYELGDGEEIASFLIDNLPDVIILDWHMPQIGGLEVLKYLRRNRVYRNIPVIVSTGMPKAEVLDTAFDFGSVDFLEKATSKSEFVARVQNVLKQRVGSQLVLEENQALHKLNSIIKSQQDLLEHSATQRLDAIKVENEKLQSEIDKLQKDIVQLKINEELYANHLRMTHTLLGKIKTEDIPQNKIDKLIGSELINLENLLKEKGPNKKLIADPNFVKKLLEINPNLSALEIDHCSYLKLNLSNVKIANIMHIEMKSLQTARYRLKKKMGLDSKTKLRQFLISL